MPARKSAIRARVQYIIKTPPLSVHTVRDKLEILVSTVQFCPGLLLLLFSLRLKVFPPLAIFFFKDFVIGEITMNRSRSGLRCRTLCNIITSKGLLPRNTEGVVRSEGSHLGRPVIFADWENGMDVP